MRLFVFVLLFSAFSFQLSTGNAEMNIPNDFIKFEVPGFQGEMNSIRQLYWHHYRDSGPKSTLWDMWLPAPSLTPAVETDNLGESMRKAWREALSARIVDRDGYVATHQHPSIAHPLGWPFPFWHGGVGGYGWHFSFKDTIDGYWRPQHTVTQEGWLLDGANDEGIDEWGWNISLTRANASITAPAQNIDTYQAPFLQLRWKARGLGNAMPYVEWTTAGEPNFSHERRMYFEPYDGDAITHCFIPMYLHPKWKGTITQLRIKFGNKAPGAKVCIQAFFTQYDTRHDTNSQSFVRGCATYFNWTGDINFLRNNINRMRTAMRYVMTEHQALKKNVVFNSWVGHEGRSGLAFPDGKKQLVYGSGIGDNYFDILPFGYLDCYATIFYYEALNRMIDIERSIRNHPEWNIHLGALALDPDELARHGGKGEGRRQ